MRLGVHVLISRRDRYVDDGNGDYKKLVHPVAFKEQLSLSVSDAEGNQSEVRLIECTCKGVDVWLQLNVFSQSLFVRLPLRQF